MKDQAINKLISIQENIKNLNTQNDIPAQIVCVSKTFPLSKLLPLVNFGHYHFGENKVQEAEEKWSELKKSNENLFI